ncbi:FtsX-like permease family protein [Actinoallomurus rhizosphaericola]|uniref:FtsX-like permease family protein n=1 Tax=Actinoallomurus rhizosphaericola TaxID=2952536 RepID=UPI0020926556|nr:FtsX-like permease family protein [Actinoallomurus rhizosphaericola]MCO5999222.1 ABC transporter permease [Actinoallomurus rhizosphaericola]
MRMFALALRSLRRRAGGFAATFVSMVFGAAMVMAFASLVDTAVGNGVPSDSRRSLITMAVVVGGWGLIMVVFSVISTLTLVVRQRGPEMALLKQVGATPMQIGRMIVSETAVVALAAGLTAILPAAAAGRALLSLLISTGRVADGVDYAFGAYALGIGLGVTFTAAIIAAVITVRGAVRPTAAESIRNAAAGDARMGRRRKAAAVVFLVLGASLAVTTATAMRGKGIDAMQTAGQTSIWVSIGLALAGPALIGRVTAALARPLERVAGVPAYLTVQYVRRRSGRLATTLMPIILFTGIATGTLYMQWIENAATAASGAVVTADDKTVETLNFTVIGMLVVFSAIMLINTLVAAMTYRRGEFARQRLAGITPGQVLQTVAVEGVILTLLGVVSGAVAGLFTIVPYSIARTGHALPDVGAGTYLGVVAVAAVLTLGTGLGAARRALRTPAVEAVTR